MADLQRETYNGAERIDSDPFGIWSRDNRNHRKKQRIILQHTAADRGDRVLEVGCGDGLHAPGYTDRFEYTGIDVSESLVAQAAERSPGTFRVGDATDLEADANAYDAVVGTAILHHLEDAEAALREWMRVVSPGGSVTLMEPNYLFPKDLVTAHCVEHEQHKTQMAPWRLRETLDSVADEWRLEPRLFTPPWPRAAAGIYDTVDAIGRRLPGARWAGQMLLIHIEC